MSEIQISVIIPVHNIEKYLNDCYYSVIKALHNFSYELIFVNNFSNDNSLAIINDFARENSNVKIFDISCKGVSKARNYGINEARGKYLAFVDGDDMVKKDYFNMLFNIAEENNMDIVCSAYLELYPSGKEKIKDSSTGDFFYLNNKEMMEDFYCKHNIGWNVWGKLFLRERVKELRFIENIKTAEDMEYIYQACRISSKFSYINVPLYIYRMRNTSSSNIYDAKDHIHIFDLVTKIFLDNSSNDQCLYFYVYYLIYCIEYFALYDRFKTTKRQIQDNIHCLFEKANLTTINRLPIKYRIEFKLLKIFWIYRIFIFFYRPLYFGRRKKAE